MPTSPSKEHPAKPPTSSQSHPQQTLNLFSITATGSIVFNGDTINDFTGSGLTLSSGALTADISESNLNINAPTDDYIMVASSTATGGFEWVATSTARLGFGSAGGGGGSSLFTDGGNYLYPTASTESLLLGSTDYSGFNSLLTIRGTSTNGALITGSTTPNFAANYLQFFSSAGSNVFSIGTSDDTDLTFAYGRAATNTVVENSPYAWTIATGTNADPLFRIDTTNGSEKVVIGQTGGQLLIGDVGNATDLVFEESSTIHGQGGNTLTFGQTGDIINFAVNTGFGSSTPSANLSIQGISGQNRQPLRNRILNKCKPLQHHRNRLNSIQRRHY